MSLSFQLGVFSVLDNQLLKHPMLWVVQSGLVKKSLGLNQFLMILNEVILLMAADCFTNLIFLCCVFL